MPEQKPADNTPFRRGVRIAFWNRVSMFKLQRVIDSGKVKLIVIGRIDTAQLPDLQNLVSAESATGVVIDLREVTLVDSDVVRFQVQCERIGLRLANCPAYIREWMGRVSGQE
jgi:hypothetical protein